MGEGWNGQVSRFASLGVLYWQRQGVPQPAFVVVRIKKAASKRAHFMQVIVLRFPRQFQRKSSNHYACGNPTDWR